MLQTHVARVNWGRITEGGGDGKADSLTGMLDNHTDAQMGKMTDRETDRVIFCYASPHSLTMI